MRAGTNGVRRWGGTARYSGRAFQRPVWRRARHDHSAAAATVRWTGDSFLEHPHGGPAHERRAFVGSGWVGWREPAVTGSGSRWTRCLHDGILPSDPTPRYGPMFSDCVIPGCGKVTMGGTCVEHDSPVSVTLPQGRPH